MSYRNRRKKKSSRGSAMSSNLSGKSRREALAAQRQISHGYPMGAIKEEFKSIDVAPGTSVLDTTGAVTLLDGCARGSDINERVGREILLRSVELKMVAKATATTGTDQTGRVLLIYDRQCNGVAPGITDILDSINVVAMKNLDNRKRFKILMDWCVDLSAAGQNGSERSKTFYRKLRHPVSYNSGTAGSVADIISGGLFLITLGSNVAGTTAGSLNVSTRVRYTDN